VRRSRSRSDSAWGRNKALLLGSLPFPGLAFAPPACRLMRRSLSRTRDNARRLFLSGEMTTNAEIAARLKTKPHTIAKWRKEEDWDSLRQKIDRRAAEMFVEKIATDRVTLNLRHYRLWDLILGKLMDSLKTQSAVDVDEMVKVTGILDRAQKGQRLAKGLSIGGETEEQIRAEAESNQRKLIDSFIDAVKDSVEDEEIRERIRQALFVASSPSESPDLE